jgi:hydroxymethylglutaryl-CoA lyase
MVSTLDKVSLIQRLVSAGCTTVEVGAFVSPKWVPQMANTAQVLESLETPDSGINFSCLVPNMEGMKRAQQYETCTEVAIFASASESFSRKNINCSIMESMERFRPILEQSTKPIRGYVSCVVACPYEGKVDAAKVVQVSEQLLEMGCYEISLGDTIGVGTPRDVRNLLDAMKVRI